MDILGTNIHFITDAFLFGLLATSLLATALRLGQQAKDDFRIFRLWIAIELISTMSLVVGFSISSNSPNEWLSFIQSVAGGAIGVMLAYSMIHELYEHLGK